MFMRHLTDTHIERLENIYRDTAPVLLPIARISMRPFNKHQHQHRPSRSLEAKTT
jgi:hypothetical protein